MAKKGNSNLVTGVENSPLGVKGAPPSLESHLVSFLLEHGTDIHDPKENITAAEHILAHIEDVMEYFEDPLCQRICRESIELVLAKKPVNAGYFIAHDDLDLSSFVSSLMHKEDASISPNWEQASFSTNTDGEPGYTEDITKTILRLRLKALSQLCEENLRRIKDTPPDDEQAIARLLKVHEKLITARKELAESLGLVRF